MRKSVLVLACAASVGVAVAMATGMATADVLDRAVCAARAEGRPDVVLAGRGRIDLSWMAEADNFVRRAEVFPYLVRIAAADGPRTLLEHDRLVLPGLPSDWIAAPRGADLVLCSRHTPATVLIARQFCTAGVSVSDIVNGEIEEVTYLGGITWLADDLLAQADGGVPGEIADDLRRDVAMASPEGHSRDVDAPHVVVFAPQVAETVAAWRMMPMSRAVFSPGAATACLVRHADLRRGIVPARRAK
jgi:hypothetical protein